MPPFNNTSDTTPDLWAQVYYPRCNALGIRINPGATEGAPPGISFDHLKERLEAADKWEDWLKWGSDAITCGEAGIYPWDVEQFLAGLANDD